MALKVHKLSPDRKLRLAEIRKGIFQVQLLVNTNPDHWHYCVSTRLSQSLGEQLFDRQVVFHGEDQNG